MKVVLSTTNAGKVVEIRAVLTDIDFVERPSDVGEVEETATTFEGNARIKARALAEATGLPALADDSGLEVDALDGAPGVRSARYAGNRATDHDNVAKLLANIFEVPDEKRTARFRTVLILREPDGHEVMADASVEGTICRQPQGANGFGYDPVFIANDFPDKTFAELSIDEKNAISHRGKALLRLKELLAV